MSRSDLEAELARADADAWETLKAAVSHPHGSDLYGQLKVAHLDHKRNAARLRRELAVQSGEEHAIWLDLGVTPEAAVSGALLVQSEYHCFLLFNSSQPSDEKMRVPQVIVEFEGTSKTTFGLPNDEAIGGHPLWGRGLECYDAFEVVNSSWIAEEERRNRESFPNSKFDCRHFIFTFHDSCFGCLADGMKLEIDRRPFSEIWSDLNRRLST
jgi:hypothetical protein